MAVVSGDVSARRPADELANGARPPPARRPLPARVARRRHRPGRDRAVDRRPRGPARHAAARRADHRHVQDRARARRSPRACSTPPGSTSAWWPSAAPPTSRRRSVRRTRDGADADAMTTSRPRSVRRAPGPSTRPIRWRLARAIPPADRRRRAAEGVPRRDVARRPTGRRARGRRARARPLGARSASRAGSTPSDGWLEADGAIRRDGGRRRRRSAGRGRDAQHPDRQPAPAAGRRSIGPSGRRTAILIDAPTFPSDRYAVDSQLRHHGLDPADRPHRRPSARRRGHAPHRGPRGRDPRAPRPARRRRCWPASTTRPGSCHDDRAADRPPSTPPARSRSGTSPTPPATCPLALHDADVDAAAWCTYKYLNSGPGALGPALRPRAARRGRVGAVD